MVPVVPKKVLFVGNSLLLGMFNLYGMCSSSPKLVFPGTQWLYAKTGDGKLYKGP